MGDDINLIIPEKCTYCNQPTLNWKWTQEIYSKGYYIKKIFCSKNCYRGEIRKITNYLEQEKLQEVKDKMKG